MHALPAAPPSMETVMTRRPQCAIERSHQPRTRVRTCIRRSPNRLLYLHTTELFATRDRLVHPDNVVSHRLGQRPALADGHGVARLQANPARGAVRSRHRVTLLVPVVLFNVVQVYATSRETQSATFYGQTAGAENSRRWAS